MPALVAKPTERNANDYPLATTRAARMFAEALVALERKSQVSQRQLAAQLGYKSSVVISHMASGRAPIPLERTMDFARALKLDPREFLLAVLDQRHPHLQVANILSGMVSNATPKKGTAEEELMVLEDLQSAAGVALADLPPEQFAIVREAAADRNATRRWASVPEMGVLDLIRNERPDVTRAGLSLPQRKRLKEALADL